MGFEEKENRPEWTAQLEPWIQKIQERWEKAPEFRVEQEKLRHLAIICDGNRRAAVERGLPSYFGHRAGIEAIKGIARACRKWNIHTLTFWVWSTENWQRDQEQVEFVMNLAEHFLPQEELLQELTENDVRFTHLGRKDRFSPQVLDALSNLEAKTAPHKTYQLNLALDYGGFDEVARAYRRMLEAGVDSELIKQKPQILLEYLDTKTQDFPDLVIRTGMKKEEVFRTSGFMPLQTAYAGWIPLSVLFPDLTPHELVRTIEKFQGYKRRLGA